jgi:preprotein translocase subunit YajC
MTIYDYSALSVLIVLVMWRAMPMFARWRSISAQHKATRVLFNRVRRP